MSTFQNRVHLMIKFELQEALIHLEQ